MIISYAALKEKSKLEKYEITLPALEGNQVAIKVINCGICHSDISAIDNAWGASSYPLIAGHEVIGQVSEIGSQVSQHKIGDVVGLGWHSGYCHACEYCQNEDYNFCVNTKKTIFSQHGGFAEFVHADEKSVIPIPQGLDLDKVGPLLCGGITVYTPIVEFGIDHNFKVGVIGIGGLGHIALKFFKALGCHVTAFTSSLDKSASIKAMGADNIINSLNKEELNDHQDQFDFIISTVNQKLNWNTYLACLKPRGRLHIVGATLEPLDLSVFNLMKGRKSVSGSPVGSPKNIVKMLAFVAQHKIYPEVEVYKFDQINKAIQAVRENKVRYRAVVKW